MYKLLFVVLLFFSNYSFAAAVDTVSIYSASMHRSYSCVVISPDSKKNVSFPALYLLHGHGGSYSNWIGRVPQLAAYADQYRMIIVCPDGTASSWYYDSPVDSSIKFETYISTEVPAYIDAHFKTIRDRMARAITGLSMGGHGGLFLGLRHARFFGACGSMSGALLITQLKNRYGISKLFGDTTANLHYYTEYSVTAALQQYPKDSIAIIMDCGTEDPFLEMNRTVHQTMLAQKIPHDYTECPGKHDWNYWPTAIQYQIVFFRNFFDRSYNKSGEK